jgi:hypothetical protein
MLDFVSTRNGADPETVGCAKLVASIIGDAIRGASLKPFPDEFQQLRNIDRESSAHDPALSIWFLFHEDSDFETYAALIGMDAQVIRDKLLSLEPVKFTERFTDMQRSYLQMRHRWYMREKQQIEANGGKFVLLRPLHQDENDSANFAKQKLNKDNYPLPCASVWDFAKQLDTTQEESNGI